MDEFNITDEDKKNTELLIKYINGFDYKKWRGELKQYELQSLENYLRR